MNPDQTAPFRREQSDLGTFRLQYRLPKIKTGKRVDNKSHDWW